MSCQRIYCIKSIFFCKYFRENSEFYTFLDIISVIRKEGYPISRKGENIYKRKDGRWEGRYMKYRSPDGKVKYGYVYAKTYREVKEKLMQRDDLIQSHMNHKPEKDPFEHIALEWFKFITPQVKESTSNKYWNLLNSYILPKFGPVSLYNITHDFIENQCNIFLTEGGCKKNGLSPKTVADILSLVRNILQFAEKKGKSISCNGQMIQIKRQNKKMRVLSRSEQEKLCEYLYSDLNACNLGILVCLFTGLRVGEVCALRWEDISFSEKAIHVHHTLQRIQNRNGDGKKTKVIITTPKSACSIRTIPIPDELLELIALYRTDGKGYFLTNSEQKILEPRTMQNHFKRAIEKSSIAPANFHSLRHTFATRCVELGFDVKSLSEILGHASVNITMNRYVHPSMELKKKNMQLLSSLLTVKKDIH